MRAILDATERVLVREGPAAVTTTRVAAVAGVSVGTLYEYFATREALVRSVEERSWGSILEALRVGMEKPRAGSLHDSIVDLVILGMNALAARGEIHGFTPGDPATIESRKVLMRQFAGIAAASLAEQRAQLRPDDLVLALEIVIKTAVTLTWLGQRDHAAAMSTGAYQRQIATMIACYLVRDDAAPR